MLKKGQKMLSVTLGAATFNQVLALAKNENRSITSTLERIVIAHFLFVQQLTAEDSAKIDAIQNKRIYSANARPLPLLDGPNGSVSNHLRRVIEQIVKATVAEAIAEAKIAQYRAAAVTDSRAE